jgi:hypothetical protein
MDQKIFRQTLRRAFWNQYRPGCNLDTGSAFPCAAGCMDRAYRPSHRCFSASLPEQNRSGNRGRITFLNAVVNSGIHSIYVLTQFLSQSLLQHLSEGWQVGGLLKSHFIINVPAQMRSENESWYRGTADAIYQNMNLIEQSDPHLVAIFGADHIPARAASARCRARGVDPASRTSKVVNRRDRSALGGRGAGDGVAIAKHGGESGRGLDVVG